MSAFDGGDMARAVFSLVLAALKQLFSKKVFYLTILFLSLSFAYKDQALRGFVLSMPFGVSGLSASLTPSLFFDG